jgi:hypothetical protein
MEDPVSGADAYSEWQERLKRFDSSGLSIDVFCQQEDVGQSTFLDWLRVLKREQFRQHYRIPHVGKRRVRCDDAVRGSGLP